MLDRLGETLVLAGIPVHTVDGAIRAPLIVYKATATAAHKQQAAAIVAAFDWSAAADSAWRSARASAAAKAATSDKMLDGSDPTIVAVRNALRIVLAAITAQRQVLAALVADHNSRFPGANIQQPPPARTWHQLLAALQQQVAAETDPGA